jgi:glucan 1,3-beta-glucosidase
MEPTGAGAAFGPHAGRRAAHRPRPGLIRVRRAGATPALIGGALAAIAAVAFWLWQARPVPLPDAPGGRIACLSYTPFRGDQTPFDQSLVIPAAQIEEDLSRLKTETDCVRTYAVNQGLDQVVPIAERLGLKVLMGIWIGAGAAENEAQIARAVVLAKAHPATLKGIIVGNEVLLRGEQSAETLAEMLRRVRDLGGVPITYADVWEFWLRHPQLAEAADFVTIHILPYWEDDPVPAAEGVAHIDAILRQVEAAFPGKRILIGETGYPSAGRQREQAVPGLVEEARFIREFLAYAAAYDGGRGLDYNIIEAFDQPWKRALEGTVGGYWGVFGEDREAKFPLTGPVAAIQSPWPRLAITLVLGLAIWWPSRRATSPLQAAAAPLLATAAGLAVTLHLDHARVAALLWHEWAVEAALATVSVLSAALALQALADPAGAPAGAQAGLGWLVSPTQRPDLATALGALQVIAVAGAASVALALAFDARYRDFPLFAFATPAIAFALLAHRQAGRRRADLRIEAVFAVLLAVCAGFIALNENLLVRPEMRQDVNAALRPLFSGAVNGAALLWCGMLLILAYPWALAALRGRGNRGEL